MSKKNLQDAMKNRNPLAAKPPAIQPVDLYSGEKKEASKKTPNEQPQKKTISLKQEELKHYTTYISDAQKKRVKLLAIEHGKKDQEIVQEALDEYFKNHPL